MELKIEHISKQFKDKTAVDDVSLTLTTGVWGLLGANGAGKTTLMRMIADIMTPSSGSVSFDGEDIRKMGADYRNIFGFLPQDFGCSRDFTVKDYLEYVAALKDVSPRETTKKINHLLDILSLSDVKGKKIVKLSGGMKRRVGIAQAMLNDPKILILDEPTAGLDPNERIRFRNLISELSEDRLVLLSTHIVSDIEYIAGEILLMNDGRLAAAGTADELIAGMKEKVWTINCSRDKAEFFLGKYKVSNIKLLNDGAELRVLSDEPPVPYAVLTDATLEDLFLHYFGERSGEDFDQV